MKRLKLQFIFIYLFSFLTFGQESLSVEKIWKKFEFSEKRFDGFKGMNNGIEFTKLNKTTNGQTITVHSYLNNKGEGKLLMLENAFVYDGKQLIIEDYEFNKNENKILLLTEREPVYRRSFLANYFIYDVKTKIIEPLDKERKRATLAEFSPDGNSIGFIFENNLYVKNLLDKSTTQVTFDGKKNEIINATTDWVYEEEFSITKAFEWSYDSKKIAYLKFDESNVKEFTIDYYTKNEYPVKYNYKYPKAGEDNSKVNAYLYSLESKENVKLNLESYEYIPRMKWSSTTNTLVILTLNRNQNELKFYKIDASSMHVSPKLFFKENSDTYVEIDDNLVILKDNSIVRTSEITGYKQLYKLDLNGNQKAITTGNWDVIDLYGVDNNNQIYYSAAEKGPIHKGIYKIALNGKNKKSLSSEFGQNDADFVNGMKYFILDHSTSKTPSIYELKNNVGKTLEVLENNEELSRKLKNQQLSTKEFFQINSTNGMLNAWIMKPLHMDSLKKHPVLLHIYGGPGHNTVTDGWGGNDYLFHQLLNQKGYIVVSVDPRGTLYNGVKHKKSTYLQMGKLELEDFISTAKYLKQLPFVDAERIGIQGWSYGGFMTSLAMTKGSEYFKTGIAVAPVTNWKWYDNIYTERFMRTPQENKLGYEDNSPIKFAHLLKGNFLIIHGTADDNVHFQNTMEMTTALIQQNKQFDQFSYPNKNHGIYGGNTRNHLYQMILNYILEKL
jgi:dipeptidyl-peptidase-4